MSDKDFKLKSSSEGFDTRTKDIFANIDSLASTSKKQQNSDSEQKQPRKRITAPSPPPEDNSSRSSDQKKRTEEFKNCESIFRTPNESGWPPARSRHDRKRPHHGNHRGPRRTPDHVVNPNKYKKYDLSDVSKDQLSDRSNSRAAFDFLRQLKDRKNNDESNENPAENSEERKVSFKKPSTFKKPPSVESTSKTSSAVQDGHKRILPEYEFGQKAKKSVVKLSDKTPEKSKIKSPSKTISLSHLDDEDEEDSD